MLGELHPLARLAQLFSNNLTMAHIVVQFVRLKPQISRLSHLSVDLLILVRERCCRFRRFRESKDVGRTLHISSSFYLWLSAILLDHLLELMNTR